MKLLFDQNLSHRLVDALEDLYPDSGHARTLGLDKADDAELWAYAAANDFAIVSKDSDFHQLAWGMVVPAEFPIVRMVVSLGMTAPGDGCMLTQT